MSRAATFTQSPYTAYSHLVSGPTAPQNASPVAIPARPPARPPASSAATTSAANATALRASSACDIEGKPNTAIATEPLSSTKN